MSLQAYVTRVLEDHTAVSSLDGWLQGLEDLPPHPDASGAASIREVRDDELL